ncbi:hypothetical protein BKA65DRAFT_483624 [Rhexocercosporidium sp. MPI-PUGE-AT-0058]|nr:hypothetical protein BKA65DRAFT_483624 [Rhexocercosporidium sp. MPI-PUGE-AT-0058]
MCISKSEGGRPSHSVSLGRDILEDPGEYREILSYWQLVNHDAENLKRSLARHGFTRPIELDKDPERQDKLTTWIEFLDFKHWFYDKDIRIVKHLQPEYDEAWKELVDSQVLKPNETEEFICSIDSVFQRASERERAEKAVKSAESVVTSAQNAITDPRPNLSEKAQRRLTAAQSRLDAAVESLKSIKRRNDLVHEFYKKTQLSQITKDAKAAENDCSVRVNGRSCDRADELSKEQSSEKQERKRGRHDDTVDDELPSKRPRYDGQRSSFSPRKTPNTADRTPTRRSQKSRTTASKVVKRKKPASGKPGLTTGESGVKSKWSTVNSAQPRKNNSRGVSSRCSARIAEREKRLRAAVVLPSDTIRTPRQRTVKLTEAPTPPSSTESQERKSRPRALETLKRGRLRRGDRRNTAKPQGILKMKGRPRP